MKTRSAVFARKLWAEILMTIWPALARLRRWMGALGFSASSSRGEMAKVIPIAPYLKQRPASGRAETRLPVRIIDMRAPRSSKRGG